MEERSAGGAPGLVPFPYAGMTQFRFEGVFSARLSPSTPNGTVGVVPDGKPFVKEAALTAFPPARYIPAFLAAA